MQEYDSSQLRESRHVNKQGLVDIEVAVVYTDKGASVRYWPSAFCRPDFNGSEVLAIYKGLGNLGLRAIKSAVKNYNGSKEGLLAFLEEEFISTRKGE